MVEALALADSFKDRAKTGLIRTALSSNSQPHTMVKSFMVLNEVPTPTKGVNLSISDRDLCLKLIFEEMLEVIHAAGFRMATTACDVADPECYTDESFTTLKPGYAYIGDIDAVIKIGFEHVEGQLQDHKEMIDGLADVVFTAFFMAIRLGYDLTPMLREVTASNFTKLDDDGKPIKNGFGKAAIGQPLYREDQPIGKILKGPRYMKPALVRLFGHLFPQPEEI